MSFWKVLCLAGMEHTQGQNLLAKHVAAFGYWTIRFLDKDSITEDKFYRFLYQLNITNIKSQDEFKKEFKFLLSRTDPRFFTHKDGVSYQDELNQLKENTERVSVDDLNVNIDEYLEGIDMERSVLGFELFKQIFLERNL